MIIKLQERNFDVSIPKTDINILTKTSNFSICKKSSTIDILRKDKVIDIKADHVLSLNETTWNDILSKYASWQAVYDNIPTWGNVLRGV